MNLNEMAVGQDGIITKIKGRGTFRKRIMEMGFVKGKKVRVVKQAPLSDPVEYEIMGYHISLRKSEAQMIEVVSMDHINEAALEVRNEKLTIEQVITNEVKDHGNIINVALVGNPNCGKTTFYNYASGSKERVGNYSGVTVDAKTAQFRYKDYIFNITDLPGTYSLTAYSAEEIYVRKFITDQNPDIVINMVDASNLERNMYLTTQLIDMDIKVVVALNMYDELEARGDRLDYLTLGKMLGIPFVPVISSKGKGFGMLFDSIIRDFEDKSPTHRHIHINYGRDIEKSIRNIQDKFFIHNDSAILSRIPSRFLALKLLEKDSDIEKIVLENVVEGAHSHPMDNVERHSDDPNCILAQAKSEIAAIERQFGNDTETLIADTRYGFVAGALKETLEIGAVNSRRQTDNIDHLLTHRIWGFPIFLLIIFLMFQATFTIGEYPMRWIEMLVEWIGNGARAILPGGIIKDMVVDGIIGGVGGVIVFLPNIVILFVFISIMEDTGYMARVAFIMDKIMHKIGLHGKSFIPLIMGFGCNVPAILATRTLENRSDRLLTMMISPYMSCSARLPLYTVMAAAFFAEYQAAISLSVYVIGILIAALTAILLRKTAFKSQDAPFVMELPPYRIPTLRSVLKHMWGKAAQYLKKMGGVILIASVIIWALGYFPLPDKEMTDSERQEYSCIGRIGKAIEPVIEPLGFNWKLGISLFTGVAAKEIVVSTMGVLYHSDDESTESLSAKIANDTSTGMPLTPYSAFGFMVFVLTYFPCIATATAIFKEGGQKRWGWLSIIYSLILAWLLAFAINMLG